MPARKRKVTKKHKLPKERVVLTPKAYLNGSTLCSVCQRDTPFRGGLCVDCMETRDIVSTG